MSVNLLKLCVGIESVPHLAERQAFRLEQVRKAEGVAELRHRTRRMPRRRDEVLAGGSIYWVIRGVIQARQQILDLRDVRGDDGTPRCDFVLDPRLVPTRPRRRRAFQGWRYLEAEDAPADLDVNSDDLDAMPEKMRAELIELGLL